MKKKILKAGVVSIAVLLVSQVIRFLGNLYTTKLLAPDAFGLMAVVNMVMMGIALFSDLGLRQIVIQQKEDLAPDLLNTVWVMQILRGIGIWFFAFLLSLLLIFIQNLGLVSTNVYASSALPYLVVSASFVAVLDGLSSTKLMTASRDMNLGRLNIIFLFSQISSVLVILIIAKLTNSVWAFVGGAVLGSFIMCTCSHGFLSGVTNTWRFDKEIAKNILKKSKWLLLSSPLTFLELNGAVLLLGLFLGANDLGLFMIGFLIIGVVQLVSQNIASNVIFPSLSDAVRAKPAFVSAVYMRLQLVSDSFVLVSAGGLIAAGTAIVEILFDSRYVLSGRVISILALGLIGLRYYVVEQLMSAYGDFHISPMIISSRVVVLTLGVLLGFHIGGLEGAAFGIALSWFAAWPILLWYRAKKMSTPWKAEFAALGFVGAGYFLGLVFVQAVHWLGIKGMHHAM